MKGLKVQKRLAAQVMKCSAKRVTFDTERLEEIKEAITNNDIRGLIKDKAIWAKQKLGNSKGRIRKNMLQKRKGRLRGSGSKKGTHEARLTKKAQWVIRIRNLREFIRELKTKNLIKNDTAKDLFAKSKGGYFRNKRHIKLYLTEHQLFRGKK
ncbi:50S ribosomal protein L19e [Candidatus Woesearchaeota archaeon]|nr:50S ribosomal protein L19e [Candidatus Woesearchaeota archaeon]